MSTTVPQFWELLWISGLTDRDPCQRKKEKEWEVGRLGRMTEGSEPVGSSLLLLAQGAGASRSAVGSP